MILTDQSLIDTVRLDDLAADPGNPRSELTDIAELAESIRSQGLLQPLLVREIGGDPCGSDGATYIIIDGHRRYAALQLLDYDDEIPVRVVDDPGTEGRLLIALTTQLHGRPLPPLDEARAFQHLVDLGLTQRQIAERVGCNQSHVSKRLSLVELPETAAKALTEGKINVREAERFARTGSVAPTPKTRKAAPVDDVVAAGAMGDVQEAEQLRFTRQQLATAQQAYDDTRQERDAAKDAAIVLAGENERLKDEVEQLHSMCDLLRARIAELEALIDSWEHPIQEDVADDLFPPRVDDLDLALQETIGKTVAQIEWENAHEDCFTRPPWPPYRSTKPDRIVTFLTTTINQTDSVRHVIAYESTHEQRPEILRAAADRLLELS